MARNIRTVAGEFVTIRAKDFAAFAAGKFCAVSAVAARRWRRLAANDAQALFAV
jgi:hypothetical protein